MNELALLGWLCLLGAAIWSTVCAVILCWLCRVYGKWDWPAFAFILTAVAAWTICLRTAPFVIVWNRP